MPDPHVEGRVQPAAEMFIRAFAEERFGLMITLKDWPNVRRRLERRLGRWMAESGPRWSGQIGRLSATQEEYHRLIEAITIGETGFFRSEHHFRALGGILQQAGTRTDTDPIRLWSAGCSTGDEAYSMAMAAAEALGNRVNSRIDVLGTDICEAALEVGRKGIYGADHFRDCPREIRDRYFIPAAGVGDWRVRDGLRTHVQFRRLNLACDPFPRDREIIFCRHVSLYMTESARKQLWRRLAEVLPPGGALMVSDAETVDLGCGLERSEVHGIRVFRRERRAS
ncbi:MAG: protein-glutamate O-methyltransferase CheR [Nitrospirae bacterium]|nr:protein-glutamate O-methyltransferase CheR [Nitrospirota bacterium]